MNQKGWLSILIISLFLKIIVSFFYSSLIVNQNLRFQDNHDHLVQLKDDYHYKENHYYQLISLDQINQRINLHDYLPLKQFIDLSQP